MHAARQRRQDESFGGPPLLAPVLASHVPRVTRIGGTRRGALAAAAETGADGGDRALNEAWAPELGRSRGVDCAAELTLGVTPRAAAGLVCGTAGRGGTRPGRRSPNGASRLCTVRSPRSRAVRAPDDRMELCPPAPRAGARYVSGRRRSSSAVESVNTMEARSSNSSGTRPSAVASKRANSRRAVCRSMAGRVSSSPGWCDSGIASEGVGT
mmetsp:Transcript_18362/g.53583  ORF Transcript_18362/g.53583 Transcript_18362/m.53583 type:complete len:212 (+) Transcript_18362:217-852(+)